MRGVPSACGPSGEETTQHPRKHFLWQKKGSLLTPAHVPGPRAWSSENGDSAWKAVMRGWRGRGKRVHHPSPPEETTNGSPASRPAVGRVAKEDKPLPRLSKVPKSFQNSDPGAGSQARWSPRGVQSLAQVFLWEALPSSPISA